MLSGFFALLLRSISASPQLVDPVVPTTREPREKNWLRTRAREGDKQSGQRRNRGTTAECPYYRTRKARVGWKLLFSYFCARKLSAAPISILWLVVDNKLTCRNSVDETQACRQSEWSSKAIQRLTVTNGAALRTAEGRVRGVVSKQFIR